MSRFSHHRSWTRLVVAERPLAINIDWPRRIYRPSHGPQVWPWWKLLSIRPVKVAVHSPSSGYNVWFYSRWGALLLAVNFDRRTPEQKGLKAA